MYGIAIKSTQTARQSYIAIFKDNYIIPSSRIQTDFESTFRQCEATAAAGE